MERYINRQQAGQYLAQYLQSYARRKDVIVLALPRGGVPVGYEIAKELHVALDVFIVRKIGVPGHSELAMGAIAMGGAKVFNDEIISGLQISNEEIETVIQKEQQELKRREIAYRGDHTFPSVKDKVVILVDDGIATGATMRAAILALRQMHVAKLIVAVPVAAKDICSTLSMMEGVDEFVCPLQPALFYAVGAWYDDFSQTEDEEVYSLLKNAKVT